MSVRCRCGRFAAYIGDRGWWCKTCDRSVKHPFGDGPIIHGDGSGVALPPVEETTRLCAAEGIAWPTKGIGSVLVMDDRGPEES